MSLRCSGYKHCLYALQTLHFVLRIYEHSVKFINTMLKVIDSECVYTVWQHNMHIQLFMKVFITYIHVSQCSHYWCKKGTSLIWIVQYGLQKWQNFNILILLLSPFYPALQCGGFISIIFFVNADLKEPWLKVYSFLLRMIFQSLFTNFINYLGYIIFRDFLAYCHNFLITILILTLSTLQGRCNVKISYAHCVHTWISYFKNNFLRF